MLKIFHRCVILAAGDTMTIYERIRQLRIKAGMSQDDLARVMGYKDRSMITKIESGKVDISQKKILAFARALNTTPGYLMGWEEEPKGQREIDLQLFSSAEQDPQIRIVSGMMDNMSDEQKEQFVAIVSAVVDTQKK